VYVFALLHKPYYGQNTLYDTKYDVSKILMDELAVASITFSRLCAKTYDGIEKEITIFSIYAKEKLSFTFCKLTYLCTSLHYCINHIMAKILYMMPNMMFQKF
jgi:hypothetical protein